MKNFILSLIPRFVSVEIVGIDFGDGDKMICEKRHLPNELKKHIFATGVKSSICWLGISAALTIKLNTIVM